VSVTGANDEGTGDGGVDDVADVVPLEPDAPHAASTSAAASGTPIAPARDRADDLE
jgi:hypothetical protein